MSKHQLNLLRQFARAASGDQLGGDELARLIVGKDGLVADPASLPAAQISAFLKIWHEKSRIERRASENFTDDALWGSLPRPPEQGRLMLLLCDVLGVPVGEAAVAIDLSEDEGRRMLAQQRDSLKFEEPRTAVLIEDEPIIRSDLGSVLNAMNVQVKGEAETIEDAIQVCAEKQPDLIIADYNLGEEKFDATALQRLRRATDAPVIFVTGYPNEVLTGEPFEPDFVIAKPYRPEAIVAAAAHSIAVSPKVVSDNF